MPLWTAPRRPSFSLYFCLEIWHLIPYTLDAIWVCIIKGVCLIGKIRITSLALCLVQPMIFFQNYSVQAQNAGQISLPRLAPPIAEDNIKPAQLMEPKNVPDFPAFKNANDQLSGVSNNSDRQISGNSSTATTLRAEAASTTLPLKTTMKLVLETGVDAKTSQPGDIFEAHVRDDLFVGTSLLLPRGSLIRGRIVLVNRPRIISRAGRIGLKLDQIVTPTGEVVPLDAALEFQKGIANQKGNLILVLISVPGWVLA